MRSIFYLIIFLFAFACTNNTKEVFWCGDHPCINKAEKEAYFKKTMIVEVRELTKDKKKLSELEKITQQAQKNEKVRIKDEKQKAKMEKKELKRKKKEQKMLKKMAKKEAKKELLEEKENLLEKDIAVSKKILTNEIYSEEFNKLVEKIKAKNLTRSYPDINDIPN